MISSRLRIDVVYDRRQELPNEQRLAIERVFEDADELANEESLEILIEEGSFTDSAWQPRWRGFRNTGTRRYTSGPNKVNLTVKWEELRLAAAKHLKLWPIDRA